jgi:acyl-CoA synthetase (NDP forming)
LPEWANTRDGFKSPLPVLNPSSVAIVGASERGRWPKLIYDNLLAGGYRGRIFPVNPRFQEIWGVPCYRDLASLPETGGHALVIVPAPAVVDALATGAAAGLKSATIYAGNIGEGSDPAIVARGIALRDLVARTGLAISGPNCMGGNALREKFFGYPNAELSRLPAGSVAFVSQSGGTLQFFCKTAAERGVRFSYMLTSGNELDLDLADFVNFFVDDPHTSVIALFAEGIRRPAMFMRAAARALEAGKPILVLKTGKSQKSRDAAQSHTGAIAGDYDVFKAVCERYGIVRCETLDDMVEHMLAFQPGRLPKGPRVGWVTTSGGTVDLLYDYIEEIGGIVSPEFSDDTKARIRDLVPAELALKNPLDSGIPSTQENATEISLAIASDPGVDMFAWAGTLPAGKRKADPAALKAILASTDKPVIAFGRMSYTLGAEALAFQQEAGVPFLQRLPETIRALGSLAFFGARAGRRIETPREPVGSSDALNAEDVAAGLAAKGLTLPRSTFAPSAGQAAESAERLGFPVVLKIVSPQFTHKTEIGGVQLDLRTPDAVERAAVAMRDAVLARDPDAKVDGYLVQEMVSGVEMIVGARSDPLYGPVLVVGAGGIQVELTKDVAFRLLPVGEEDARNMLAELQVGTLLAGYRGKPAADIDALVAAICGLSEFYLDHCASLADLEINPLIVLSKGNGVRAVDIRHITRNAE